MWPLIRPAQNAGVDKAHTVQEATSNCMGVQGVRAFGVVWCGRAWDCTVLLWETADTKDQKVQQLVLKLIDPITRTGVGPPGECSTVPVS